MLETRFKDREFLSRYHLDIKLLNNYDFQVKDVIPVRKVYILETNKGNKVLKKLDYSSHRLCFIDSAMEYMKKNDFKNGVSFERNKNGDIYTQWRESTYVVMNLVDGRECEFNNPIEVSLAVKALAKMHLSSRGFGAGQWEDCSKVGKVIEEGEKNLGELDYFKKLALTFENRSSFDEIFLTYVDKFISHMAKGISILKRSQYHELCREEEKISLCHHDLAYHNILVYNEEISFIDFDYAAIDLRISDVCNLINKITKGFAYDFEKLKDILEEYNKVTSIDSREFMVLYGMLWIPVGFHSLVKDYYLKRKLWSEESFVYKLKNKIGNLPEKEDMLKTFKNHYKIS